MTARRILLRVLIVTAFVLICFFAIWRIFRVDDKLRFAILDNLRPQIGNSLQIEDLYVRPFSVYLKNTALELSSQSNVNIHSIKISVAPITAIFRGIQSPGAIREIEFIRPQFYFNTDSEVSPTPADTTPDSIKNDWSYSPELLEKLHELSLIDKIRISRGQLISGPQKTLVSDKLGGFVEWSSNSSVILNVTGTIPQVPGMMLEITGDADLKEQNFLLICQLSTSDLGECDINRIIPNLECHGGSVLLEAELSGNHDIILIGRLSAENLNLSYNFTDKKNSILSEIILNNCFFDGALFGNEFQFAGSFDLNGLPLPIEGGIIFQNQQEKPFTFIPEWHASVHNPFIDLSKFNYFSDSTLREDVPFSGIADLLIEISGKSSDVSGNFDISSDQIIIDSVSVDDLSISLQLDENVLSINSLNSTMFGGSFWANGQIGQDIDDNSISMQFYRKWQSEELCKWTDMRDPYLSIQGSLFQSENKWLGTGSGSLFSSTGTSLLTGKLEFDNNRLGVIINHRNEPESIEIDILMQSGAVGNSEASSHIVWEITGKNPQKVLSNVLSEKIKRFEIDDYELIYELKGSNFLSGEDSNIGEGFISWQSFDNNRNGSIIGALSRDTTGTLNLDSELEFSIREYPNNVVRTTKLTGPFNVSIQNQLFSINELELVKNQQLSGVAQKVFFCAGNFNMEAMTPDSLEIVFDEFPLIGFLKYYKSDIPKQVTSSLGAMILADNDSIIFSGFSNLSGIEQQNYTVAFAGNWTDGSLLLSKGSLIQPDGKQVMGASGSVNFKNSSFDSLLITTDDLELEALFNTFAPDKKALWGGSVDARLELDGPMPFPNATLDAHLNSGVLYNEGGYWGNLRMVTEDEHYNLVGFDFGRGLSGLVRANGEFNRNSREYEVELTGENVEIQSLVMALTGNSGIVSGSSRFAVLLRGEKLSDNDSLVSLHQASGELIVEPGDLAGLEFDNLSAHFRLLEQDWQNPRLEIDSISVNWGESNAKISGTLPLTNQKEKTIEIPQIDITGSANGNFAGWLPRLTDSFSSPAGNGQIDFSLGGPIDSPKLTSAKIKLSGGGFKADDIVRKVSSLAIDIQLDSLGKIHIDQLEGKIDGQWIRVSNRFPEPGDTTQTIRFSDYDMGVLGIQTDDDGVWAVIPSLMEDEWGGYISISGKSKNQPFEIFGPASKPYATGKLGLRKTTFTYPFIEGSGNEMSTFQNELLDLLARINWDVTIVPQWDCRYINEISGLKDIPLFETLQKNISSALFDFDVKLYLDIQIDEENSYLNFNGAVEDTFRLNGEISANRGSVEYLDLNFEVQQVGLRMNSAEFNPILSGAAATTVYDSTGIPREVRLVIRNSAIVSEENNDPLNLANGSGWDEISLIFEDDQGHSQEQILAMMGYAPDQLSQKLFDLGGTLVEKAVPIKRWTRYLERNLERFLGIDKVDIDPQVAHNLIERQFYNRSDSTMIGTEEYNYLMALNKSKVTIGKHLNRDTYITYTALLQHGVDSENDKRLGMMHYWDLLIRLRAIAPNLNLNYRYQYDGLTELDDHSFRINYGFYLDK
ncbi:MAG: hypothetical protein HN590_12895 [Calditrichaeota bacterium]|nr:hypothetical protein [Calditrichota bacterium]